MGESLRQLFQDHAGKVSDKWSLYLDEMDRLFAPYRDHPIHLLEIGVQNGGSLEIWAKYFPEAKKIVGCDVDERCRDLEFDDPRIAVVVGDANSDACARELLEEAPEFDIIIDDGSHEANDIIGSFARYFPSLTETGLYSVEDLHCSYWADYGGGLRNPFSPMSFFKRVADIINFEHWRTSESRRQLLSQFVEEFGIRVDEFDLTRVHSVEFVNSLCIVKKRLPEQNTLGKRIIAGQREPVTTGWHKFAGTAVHDIEAVPSNDSDLDVFRLLEVQNSLERTVAGREVDIERLQGEVERLQGDLERLQDNLERLQETLNRREEILSEKDQKIADLEDNVLTQQDRIRKAETSLAKAETSVRDKEEEIESLGLELRALEEWKAIILNSRSWQLTKPLRDIVRVAREFFGLRSGEVHMRASVHLEYSIDHLEIGEKQLFGWGWVGHPSLKVDAVEMRFKTPLQEMRVECDYGQKREDVAKDHTDLVNAHNSGFLVSESRPVPRFAELQLFVQLEDGSEVLIPLRDVAASPQTAESSARSQPPARGRGALSFMPGWVGAGAAHLVKGEFKAVVSGIRSVLTRSSPEGDSDRIPKIHAQDLSLSSTDLTLVLDHNLGGGANKYRRSLVEERISLGQEVIVTYFDLASKTYLAELRTDNSSEKYSIGGANQAYEFFEQVEVAEVFVNTLYSHPRPMHLAEVLTTNRQSRDFHLTLAVHDYFPVCPSYTLIDHEGKYCGIPSDLEICERCLSRHGGDWTQLMKKPRMAQWRQAWGRLIDAADEVLCFSRDSIEHLQRAYPGIDASKMTLRPHQVDYLDSEPVEILQTRHLNIGILGEISYHKGAGIVREMARLAETEGLHVRITVIGTLVDAPESEGIEVTGEYRLADLPEVIRASEANIFFIPSVWPETFSYTTEELMELGVPVAVFDIGAPAERVAKYEKGLIIERIDAAYALQRLRDWHRDLYASDTGQSGLGAEQQDSRT